MLVCQYMEETRLHGYGVFAIAGYEVHVNCFSLSLLVYMEAR